MVLSDTVVTTVRFISKLNPLWAETHIPISTKCSIQLHTNAETLLSSSYIDLSMQNITDAQNVQHLGVNLLQISSTFPLYNACAWFYCADAIVVPSMLCGNLYAEVIDLGSFYILPWQKHRGSGTQDSISLPRILYLMFLPWNSGTASMLLLLLFTATLIRISKWLIGKRVTDEIAGEWLLGTTMEERVLTPNGRKIFVSVPCTPTPKVHTRILGERFDSRSVTKHLFQSDGNEED